VAHADNLSYSRSWDQVNHSSRPTKAKKKKKSLQGVVEWSSGKNTCQASMKVWIQTPVLQKKKKMLRDRISMEKAGLGDSHLLSQWQQKPKIRGQFKPCQGKKQGPISKISRAKRPGGVAQVLKSLTSQCEALDCVCDEHMETLFFVIIP
jgi:hypothetical protein